MAGGGNGQFAAVPMNLLNASKKADYLVTGSWSKKAAKEATKYGIVNQVLPVVEKYHSIPSVNTWKMDPEASYLYYCDNETIDGKLTHSYIILNKIKVIFCYKWIPRE